MYKLLCLIDVFNNQCCVEFGRRFPKHLQDEGYAPASVRNMLNSASTFLTYVKRFRVLHSDLSDDETSALLHHLKRLQVDMCRGVAVHLSEYLIYKCMETDEQSNEY